MTTLQIVFLAAIVILVALAAFALGAWYEHGHAKADIAGLEADLAEMGERRAARQEPRHALPVAGRLELTAEQGVFQQQVIETGLAEVERARAIFFPAPPVEEDETPSEWTRRNALEFSRDIAAMIDRTDAWLREISR